MTVRVRASGKQCLNTARPTHLRSCMLVLSEFGDPESNHAHVWSLGQAQPSRGQAAKVAPTPRDFGPDQPDRLAMSRPVFHHVSNVTPTACLVTAERAARHAPQTHLTQDLQQILADVIHVQRCNKQRHSRGGLALMVGRNALRFSPGDGGRSRCCAGYGGAVLTIQTQQPTAAT